MCMPQVIILFLNLLMVQKIISLYHANSEPGQGCGKYRSPRAQKFTWNKDGSPNFGVPVAAGVNLNVPSGTDSVNAIRKQSCY